MGVFGAYYRNVGRRFSTLLLTVTVGAYLFDLTFNKGTEAIWDWVSFSVLARSHALCFRTTRASNGRTSRRTSKNNRARPSTQHLALFCNATSSVSRINKAYWVEFCSVSLDASLERQCGTTSKLNAALCDSRPTDSVQGSIEDTSFKWISSRKLE